ncbi:unnamed protein product [Closterium sp. NIES-65]|nr:unnamed protein product [Closterium sp. NIES-65]
MRNRSHPSRFHFTPHLLPLPLSRASPPSFRLPAPARPRPRGGVRALRGQPAALYVLHAFALRARTAAPSALAAPTAPTSSQKRDPAAAAATARVAQAVARQGIERAVLGEVVADGHVCRRLHCLAARLQAAAPAAGDAAAAEWGVPRVPADVECQLASVLCPLAACRMVQQAADAGSAGGNACGDAAGGVVGSDGEEGSDWDSESGEVWMGWTAGRSDDDESEGGEEGGERAESALLKSSSQHPLPPPQHPHDHATPRSQREEPKIEGLAVGAGGAGAEGDDAVLRGFGRALSLVLAQYEAGVAQLARACIASLSASSPTAATDCSSPARSQAGTPAGPSDAVLLLAMRSRRLRAQLRRLVMLLGWIRERGRQQVVRGRGTHGRRGAKGEGDSRGKDGGCMVGGVPVPSDDRAVAASGGIRGINHLLPLFLHPVSRLVVRTAQQQHILLSAPDPTIRQLASRLSSLLSALLLPHSHPFLSLPTNGNKPSHIQTALASDWSIDFTLAGVARTREIVQHRLAIAELQACTTHREIAGQALGREEEEQEEGTGERSREEGMGKGAGKWACGRGAGKRARGKGAREEGMGERSREVGMWERSREGSRSALAVAGRMTPPGTCLVMTWPQMIGPGRALIPLLFPICLQAGIEPFSRLPSALSPRSPSYHLPLDHASPPPPHQSRTGEQGSSAGAVHNGALPATTAPHYTASSSLPTPPCPPPSCTPSMPWTGPAFARYQSSSNALSSALDTAISRACLSSLPLLLPLPPPHIHLAILPLLHNISAASPTCYQGLGAFDFVRVGYDPGWPASVVIPPQLVQQYADVLTALIRLQHVQRAVENITLHVKRACIAAGFGAFWRAATPFPPLTAPCVRPPALFPSFPPPSVRAAQLVSCMLAFMSAQLQRAAQHGDQILLLGTQAEHMPYLDLFSFQEAHAQFLLYCTTRCLLDARSAAIRERLDSLLQLVLDVHRSVDSARMVAPLSEFFLDDDAPIWEEVEEHDLFRINRSILEHIVAGMQHYLEPIVQRSILTMYTAVLIPIKYLASGISYVDISYLFGISKTLCHEVVDVFLSHFPSVFKAAWVRFPTREELPEMAREFAAVKGVPAVVGAVDGTHIHMKGMEGHRTEYWTTKSAYAVQLQVTCDARGRIWDYLIGYPGSAHDMLVFKESALLERLQNGDIAPYQIVGDAAYPLREYCLTPLHAPRGEDLMDDWAQTFNYCQSATRMAVERCIGAFKGRWRIFGQRNDCRLWRLLAGASVQSCLPHKLDRLDMALRSSDHASYAHTELDRRLEAALRSGDHTAALRVNEAIIRRESARRQRQAEWHMQLAASLQEQESARRKKRQRLNWGMDVLRKSEGKGNIRLKSQLVRAFTELTFESAPSRSQLVRAFTELAPSIQYPVPISPPSPLFPRLSRLNPIPLSSPSPTFFPHPPPLSPRSAFPRPPGDVVSCGVDRAFTELAELDKSPGSDGRQVINVPELYTGILIVYDKVNQLVPGMHIKPPSKKQVLQLVQDYDINHDGVLDREEFGKLVRHFARTVVARVLINVLLIFSLVPLVVSIASNLAETFGWELPEAIAATVLTLLVKMVGV